MFAHGYQVFPSPFVEKTILPCWIVLSNLLKIYWPYYGKVYFWDLCPIQLIYMSVLMPVPHYSVYYSFLVSFEMRKCEYSNFVTYCQDILHIWGPLTSIWILGWVFLFLTKKSIGIFYRNCIESVHHFWQYCHLVFLISFLNCSLLVYRNVTNFCKLILYPATLMNLFINFVPFYCGIFMVFYI